MSNDSYTLNLPRDLFSKTPIAYLDRQKDKKHYGLELIEIALSSLKRRIITYQDFKSFYNTDYKTKKAISIFTQYHCIEKVEGGYTSFLFGKGKVSSPKRNRCSAEYRNWRRMVFERDDYTCQMCGKKGVKLNAHHIVEWAIDETKRYDINNGTTLCESCHKTIHRRKYD